MTKYMITQSYLL